MPRKRTDISAKHLTILKKKILEESKIELIRSIDCDKLAHVISQSTNTHINGITFKRLYGFTKYPFNPSIQTLDILSEFIGYINWYEFESTLSENQPITIGELDILLSFYDFDLINSIEFHDGGIQSMSRKIALRFREDVSTFNRAIPSLVKKKHAQVFFIEHFPDYDNLCRYYYALYEAYLNEVHHKEGLLFGHSMLFLKSFWILNTSDCYYHIQQIRKTEIKATFHPYLIGRYYACNLLYEFNYGDPKKIEVLFSDYLKLRLKLPKDGKHFLDFPASEYIVSEALMHIEEYDKCKQLVSMTFNEFSLKMEFTRKGYYRQLELFYLISEKKINPVFSISDALNKIKPENFYFISEKYFSAIYHFALFLENQKPDNLEKANDLALEMGNLYLQKMFDVNDDLIV